MPRKCPEGVFCIENYTMVILFIIAAAILYYIVNNQQRDTKSNSDSYNPGGTQERERDAPSFISLSMPPSLSMPSISMPLITRPVVPINVPTQHMGDRQYTQIGILTRINGPETILPLMGRQLIIGRDTWNFYTMNENMIRLPISFKNKNCDGEYGCDNIFNGDTVYVQGINDAFQATIYENNGPRYIPYL